MKKQPNIKKLVLLNLPYLLMGLFATNFGEAWRLAVGVDASQKTALVLLRFAWGATKLLAQPAPYGFVGGAVLRCWPVAGGLSQEQERQEVPARYGVWLRPLGHP